MHPGRYPCLTQKALAEANALFDDVQQLLDDCSQKERKVLLEIAAAVKQNLRDAA